MSAEQRIRTLHNVKKKEKKKGARVTGGIPLEFKRHVKKCVVLAPPNSQTTIFNSEENITEL